MLNCIENNHATQLTHLIQFLNCIWKLPQDGTSSSTNIQDQHSPIQSAKFLGFLCRNPHILDILHLHGLIPNLIQSTFCFVCWLLRNPTQDYHQDFSMAFTVIYVIVERFEIIQHESARCIFERMMEWIKNCDVDSTIDSDDQLRLCEWFSEWFYDAVPADHAREEGDDGMNGDGDRLLSTLLEAQRRREANDSISLSDALDSTKVMAFKKDLSPVRILQVSHYVTRQCIYAVAANRCKPLGVFSMLAMFCEHFGNHVEIGISLSLRTCLHHIFFATRFQQFILQLINQLMQCLSQRQNRSIGYSVGSVMLHNILKRHVHLVNQNSYDVNRNPTMMDYERYQHLMRDEYTIVRNPAMHPAAQWQGHLIQTPPIAPHSNQLLLLPLVANANSSSSSSSSVPSISTTLSCSPHNLSYALLLRNHLYNLVNEEQDTGQAECITYVRQFCSAFGPDQLFDWMLKHLNDACGGSQDSSGQLDVKNTSWTHPSGSFKHHQSAFQKTAIRMAEAIGMSLLASVQDQDLNRILQYAICNFVNHHVGDEDDKESSASVVSTKLLLAQASAIMYSLLLVMHECPHHVLQPLLKMIKIKSHHNVSSVYGRLDHVDTISVFLIHLTEKLVKVPLLIAHLFQGEEGQVVLFDWALTLKNKYNKYKVAIQLFDLRTAVGRRMALNLSRDDH
ncbi:hypothetical protein AKO1_015210 [Acrasis kona]|uniref:Uncharacterized protein n=1 Tax=Acrasis kona TaxID=1008807 RepID=A0AAW2ZCS0_9EUKA